MKSYSQVYNNSKAEVLSQRKAIIESQKAAVVNVLKENYMITGKMSELDADKKAEMAKKLAVYWSPKNGLTQAGIKLLNENVLTLSKDSTVADVKLYIEKQTRKNIEPITEAFRMGRQDAVVSSFNEEIVPMIGRRLKDKFIINTVWDIVGNRIKNGNK